MSRLKAVKPTEVSPKRAKVAFYGKAGVGKTFAALDFPNPYFIDTEGTFSDQQYIDKLIASGGEYMGPEQGSLSLKEVIEQVKALATEKHNFKTLVIDSATELFNGEVSNEVERMERAGRDMSNTFSAEKKPAARMTRSLLQWIKRLDMNVVLTAHEKSEWGKDDKGVQVETGKIPDGYDKLDYTLDLVIHITKVAGQRKAFVKKTRIKSFPDGLAFPWSYSEFSKKYGVEIINKEHTEIILATQDQIIEVNGLIAMAKIPQKTVDEWFTKNNVGEFTEMSSESVGKIIAYINSKIQPKE